MQQVNVNVSGGGKLTSEEIDALYFAMKDGLMSDGSALVGQCTADAAYEDAVNALHERFPQFSVEVLKLFVRFKDPEVLRVLLANAAHAYPDGFTTDELLNITDISSWFQNNTSIVSFNELKYLKNIYDSNSCRASFNGCTELESVEFSDTFTYFGLHTSFFNNCSSLKRIKTSTETTSFGLFLPRSSKYKISINAEREGVIYFPKATSIRLGEYRGNVDCVFLPNVDDSTSEFYLWNGNGYIYDIGKKCKKTYWFFVNAQFDNLNIILRADEITNYKDTLTNGGFRCRNIFCKPSVIDSIRTKYSSNAITIALIGGAEWVAEMQRLAEIEGYVKPDNIGWDYEYIDYLIYGVEPPTE